MADGGKNMNKTDIDIIKQQVEIKKKRRFFIVALNLVLNYLKKLSFIETYKVRI
jgi:hypothetical protein